MNQDAVQCSDADQEETNQAPASVHQKLYEAFLVRLQPRRLQYMLLPEIENLFRIVDDGIAHGAFPQRYQLEFLGLVLKPWGSGKFKQGGVHGNET